MLLILTCRSLHVSSGFASSVSATIPAASGALAEVPVWVFVQAWCRSVVTIIFSPVAPLEYVLASVLLHASEYHGMFPFSVAAEMESV